MLNLTRQEKQVILFLTAIALAGMLVNFSLKKFSRVKILASRYIDFGKVNINTADKDSLESIPGIGEKLAQRIIEYRQKQARFNDVDELRQIKGITDYRFQKLKDSLLVR